ncbi:hypothetical protein F5Y19DRAFT_453265 [Xylariaceae sp. FL1651]|nr:hypothetical protein F5Y19DRAFT_453265 [Xylariaceae sp. FL1651]
MRLRRSNQEKRFEPPNYALDLDLSDADETLPRVNSSEDEFIVAAAAGNEEQDDDVQSNQDEDGDALDLDQLADRTCSSSAAKIKKPLRAKGETHGDPEQKSAEVPPYPSDPAQRWTRTYIGPVKRWTRFYELIDWWFGDKANRRTILDGFMRLWWRHELIPPKLLTEPRLLKAQSGWMRSDFADEQISKFRQLYSSRLAQQFQKQKSTFIDKAKAFRWFLPQAQGDLGVFLGHVSGQKQYRIRHGETISFADTGIPIDDVNDQESITGGWLLDVAGIAISLAWAPAQGHVNQLLAIAVIPFRDQAYYHDQRDAPQESEQKEGTVQILTFEATKDRRGILRPSRRAPKLAHALCFSWGRVSRMQWCPTTLTAEDTIRLLGVLCVDGKLRIIGIPTASGQDSKEIFEEIEAPMIILEPPKEYSIEITCFTWINMNRVAAGLSDGSVAMWSLSPPRLLLRHPVHSAAIMDIVSGYPSDPFVVTTIPIGGVLTLTDLNRPSAEMTYHPNIMVSLQPNLLAWSPHLRGYASIWPSAFPGNPNLTFLPVRGFPVCRHLITVQGQPTCVAIGICHPYLLVGTTDGSLWSLNILRKLSSHRQRTLKVKLFQHEHRAVRSSAARSDEGEEAKPRGVCRILHGFLPEPNTHPTSVKMAETQRQNRRNIVKGDQVKNKDKDRAQRKPAKPRTKPSAQTDGDVDEESAMTSGPGPITLHDPQTRVTAVAWNPNVEYSWWAAAAMGSGLVRVMDLGVESGQQQKDDDTSEPDIEDEDAPDVANDEYTIDAMDGYHEDEEEDDDVEMNSWEE